MRPIVINLVIPLLFLAAAACSAYGAFVEVLPSGPPRLSAGWSLSLRGNSTQSSTGETNDAGVYMNLAGAVAGVFLSMAAAWLIEKIVSYIAKGEAKNYIPLIGGILSAIAAAGTAAQIGETVTQVIRSPKTFDYKLSLIHDVTVTINHDHNDTSGFPATAATYEVIALLDEATTRKSGRLPLTDFRVNQVPYTFKGLPWGGKVRYSVGFYAEDGWCAGQAQTVTMDNTVDAVSMEITENEVPLTQNTYYWHLQKTEVDPSSGSLIWYGDHQSPAPAPTLKAADLNCGNPAGRLCSLGGITVSETYAAIGLTWQSSSEAISDCGGTGTGQLYQFGTLSLLGSPQSSAIVPECGSRLPFMMVFSLLGKNNDNYYLDPTTGQYHVRQIRFNGPGQGAAYDPTGFKPILREAEPSVRRNAPPSGKDHQHQPPDERHGDPEPSGRGRPGFVRTGCDHSLRPGNARGADLGSNLHRDYGRRHDPRARIGQPEGPGLRYRRKPREAL